MIVLRAQELRSTIIDKGSQKSNICELEGERSRERNLAAQEQKEVICKLEERREETILLVEKLLSMLVEDAQDKQLQCANKWSSLCASSEEYYTAVDLNCHSLQ
ncbi:hypothetical protein ACP70R_048203 [Stipagrostis hirtigluma subsp. patula]